MIIITSPGIVNKNFKNLQRRTGRRGPCKFLPGCIAKKTGVRYNSTIYWVKMPYRAIGGDRMPQPQAELCKLEGVVTHTIFENPDTGYSVFEVECRGTPVVVAGTVGSVDNGMSVTVYGRMKTHPTYGEQFAAESCEASLPADSAAILSYLASGVLPYIGPSTARKLVERFGDDTLNVIGSAPEKLCTLRGITPQKAAAIAAEFRRTYGVREVVAWMAKHGLSAQQAVTAYRTFGPGTVEALEQNPYLLCGEPLSLKFSQADAIAARLQVEQGSGLRVAAGILYALRHNANNGHTCLPRPKLEKSVAGFLRVEPERAGDCRHRVHLPARPAHGRGEHRLPPR